MKINLGTYLKALIGLLFVITGLLLIKQIPNPEGIMKALPFVMVGIGCGIFGDGMGNLISKQTLQNSPKIQQQIEIDLHDERNIAIANKAKAKGYDIMTFVFGALMLSFALMGIDLAPILLLLFAYLFVQGSAIYYRIKFDKEM